MKGKHRFIIQVAVLVAYVASNTVCVAAGSYNVSFKSINRYSSDTNDIERSDDVRSFTSEALFSQSSVRLNRPLTQEELRSIARKKDAIQSYNNLRFALVDQDQNSTALDLFYKYQRVDEVQITNFFQPTQFNDINLDEYGVAVQTRTLSSSLFLRAKYSRADRIGIVEFFPETKEKVDTLELNAAFRIDDNPDTASLFATYVYQDIQPDITAPPDRKRSIMAVGFTVGEEEITIDPRPTYAIDSMLERRFDPRGLKFYGGYILDTETYDTVDVTKSDIYAGWTLPVSKTLLAIQPAYFSYEVDNDPSQDNAQVRLDIKAYYQPLETITLVAPVKIDHAISGPDYYENWRVGGMVRYENESSSRRWYLATHLRAEYQKFINLDKNVTLYEVYFLIAF